MAYSDQNSRNMPLFSAYRLQDLGKAFGMTFSSEARKRFYKILSAAVSIRPALCGVCAKMSPGHFALQRRVSEHLFTVKVVSRGRASKDRELFWSSACRKPVRTIFIDGRLPLEDEGFLCTGNSSLYECAASVFAMAWVSAGPRGF